MIRKYFKGTGWVIIEVLSWHFPGETEEIQEKHRS
jgi:hypothetical protein